MKVVVTLIASMGLACLSGANAADPAALWVRQIQPLFDVQCVKCHGPIEQKSGLALDSPEGALRGGDEGPAILPGDPDRSRLVRFLEPGADPHMPPKRQLTEGERAMVREWIAAMAAPQEPPSGHTPGPSEFGSVSEAVDTLLTRDWERSGVAPAPMLEDPTWCRRVYLDLAGRIPNATEVAEFLAAPPESRRPQLVDRLLDSEAYAVRMRELWDVLLMGRVKREAHEDRRRQNGWWTFLETGFRSNRPWDRMVRDILAARPGDPEAQGASWFLYERRNNHQAMAEAVAPILYGTRIDCAQCHDHPLAREVKQAHYWGLVAAFNRSKNVEGGAEVAESAIGGFVNFTNLRKESQPAVITLLDGRVIEERRPEADTKEADTDDLYRNPKDKVRVPKFSRREALSELATRDNPLLARAFVNRMWAVLLGRGLVHPPDEMTARNPPSHPALLQTLSADFAAHHYDIRRLVRGLVLSRVYALGTAPHETPPPESFASALERPLSAEQLARSWRVAVGLPPEDETLRRAVTAALPEVMPRDYSATFQQAQFLTRSPALENLLKPGSGSTLHRLATERDVALRSREACLAVLGRAPDAEEADRLGSFLAARADQPEEATRDLLWALMTSAEFLTLP